MNDFSGLRISGQVAVPGGSDWDQARLAWNLAVDQNPEAVVFAESAGDVAATIAFAAGNGLKVAAQGTGHGAGPLPPLIGTILLPARTGSRPCPAPRPTSASSATRSAPAPSASTATGP